WAAVAGVFEAELRGPWSSFPPRIGSAKFAEQILMPDQHDVGADVVDPRGFAERRQPSPRSGEAGIARARHAGEEHDEARYIAIRVLPRCVPLDGAGGEHSTGRCDLPDLHPLTAGQRDDVRFPVA